jgi:HD-GYP domain-containing protein (c-di-GMP phosphodiesterase class II)
LNNLSDSSALLLEKLAHHNGVSPEVEIASLLQQEAGRVGLPSASPDGMFAAYDALFESWADLIEGRDQESRGHARRVTQLVLRLAQAMHVPADDLPHIRRGAMLHDIGKMGIPDSILLKQGALTDAERRVVEEHPALAYEMLSKLPFLQPALDIPYCHHERWDGSGYPRRLREDQIPLYARMFSVVDVWDALTSVRPYAKPLSSSDAAHYLREQSGIIFDPAVISVFLNLPDPDITGAQGN